MPEEMRFLLRAGAYGIGIALIYYFLSREPAGTILMFGFGLASVGLLAVLWWERRRRGWHLSGAPWRWALLPPPEENGGFTDEVAMAPGASLAPITLALGMALAGLGLVFGPWLLGAAIIPLIVGTRGWLSEASSEYGALERHTAGAQPPGPAVVKRR